jgi:hypothetical protein
VVTAPIRGTSAWLDGMLVGIGVGAAGFVSWWYLLSRPSFTGRLLAGSAAAVLVAALLTSSGGKYAHAAPDVDTGYLAFAVTYAAIGGAGMFVFLPRILRGR